MNLINKYFVNSNNIRIFIGWMFHLMLRLSLLLVMDTGNILDITWNYAIFSKNKYGVYAIDHRNHGQSEGRRDIDSFFDFISDFDEMVSIIQDSYPEKEIYTFGHSMGGLITFVYGLMHSERGIKGQIFLVLP